MSTKGDRRLARQYNHRIADDRSCNRLGFALCLYCVWRGLTGARRRARRELDAKFRRFEECPHTNRRPNSDATAVRKAEVCDDCGIGIIYAR